MKFAPALALLLVLACPLPASAAEAEPDPLGSARWEDMRKLFFPAAAVVFDERVRVTAPLAAEDSMNVPVRVEASALADVRQVVVFADFNPILEVLRYYPERGQANLGFRVKLQQSTPLRAAALTADGVWHLGGTWVNTAGGGCTAPSTGSASPEWQRRLGEVSGRLWSRGADSAATADDQLRLRLRIVHPMDTGLAAGIPAFFIQELQLTDAQGRNFMRIEAFEPVAENPVFTVDLPAGQRADRVRVSGRDNNGNAIDAWIEP